MTLATLTSVYGQARQTASDLVASTPVTSNTRYRDVSGTGVIPKRRRAAADAPEIGFVPRHKQPRRPANATQPASYLQDAIGEPVGDAVVVPDGVDYEFQDHGATYVDDGVYDSGGCGCGDCNAGGCGGGCGGCAKCGHGLPFLGRVELFAGTHGFTGAVNRGESGSFGFHEGLNWSRPLWRLTGGLVTGQLGFRATQSNLSGTALSNDDRHQFFLTGGFFRRSDWGLQGGLVFDYLSDNFYEELSLTQLRGELSWKFPCHHELGFWFTAQTRDDGVSSAFNNQLQDPGSDWQSTDIFAFFYRRQFWKPGSEGRLYVAVTGTSDAVLGGDLRVPLTPQLTLRNTVTYLIPNESDTLLGPANEAWNVAMTLVWTPGCGGCGFDYARPLFDVADNGSFITDRR